MVLITMTPSIVKALEKLEDFKGIRHESNEEQIDEAYIQDKKENQQQDTIREGKELGKKIMMTRPSISVPTEGLNERLSNTTSPKPSLESPKVGNPISHTQVMAISSTMKAQKLLPCTLDKLLQGSNIYILPPPPKPEQSSEYKALMARLRREQEARSYERMTHPPQPMETFAQRFPLSSSAHAFSASYQPLATEDDGITYADVDRQMALIFNVLLSIVACAGAIWVAARWWSTPARLALSMSGSLLVGVAEVVVYMGYIRKVSEAKGKEKTIKETKQIMQTWIIGKEEKESEQKPRPIIDVASTHESTARRRRREN